MKIDISQEDYEFLKNLKKELNEQTTDGTAQPVFWGVLEDKNVLAVDGDGEPYITHSDGVWDINDAIEYVESIIDDYDEDTLDDWKSIDKTSMDDVYDFIKYALNGDAGEIIYLKKDQVISKNTGAFLTKKACKEYIEKFGYNHSNPKTYAMCAFRNFELEKLLDILRNLNFSEQ